MSQELFNTSAPHGVKPGSGGFCTVAVTAGMSPPLEERLTLLSGYRWMYPPGEADAHRNPVSYAHWRIPLGGRTYSVLSRVCDAGFDYSRRSNRFAHHVVLEPHEQVPAGPAWLLARPGFMETAWTGEPRTLPAGRPIPHGGPDANPPRCCTAWEEAAGDPGWAGVLAQSFVDDLSKPAFILYHPGAQPILTLIDEALALLPPEQRWQVTFNTYFTDLPAGLACAWRCCAAGSKAAADARRQGVTGLVIDLTRPGALAPDGPGTAAARFGRLIAPAPAVMPPAPVRRRWAAPRHDEAHDAESAEAAVEPAGPMVAVAPPPPPLPSEQDSGLQDDEGDDADTDVEIESTGEPGPLPYAHPSRGAPRRSMATVVIAVVALVLVIVAAGFALYIARRHAASQAAMAQVVARLQQQQAQYAQLGAQYNQLESQRKPNGAAPADDALPADSTALAEAVKKKDEQIGQLQGQKDTLAAELDAAKRVAAHDVATREREITKLRQELADLAARAAGAPTTAAAAVERANDPPPPRRVEPARPPRHDPALSARERAVDVLEDRIILWRGPRPDSADRIKLEHGPTPPGVAVVQPEPTRIALRPASKAAGGGSPVTLIDLATVQLRDGAAVLEWRDKRRFKDITGAATWLALARLRVYRRDEPVATVSFFAPERVVLTVNQSPSEHRVLPDIRGKALDGLTFGDPAPGPDGWRVERGGDGRSLMLVHTRHVDANFNLTLDVGGLTAKVRSNWLAVRNRYLKDELLGVREELEAKSAQHVAGARTVDDLKERIAKAQQAGDEALANNLRPLLDDAAASVAKIDAELKALRDRAAALGDAADAMEQIPPFTVPIVHAGGGGAALCHVEVVRAARRGK